MQSLNDRLRGARQVVVLAVGSELRGDDGVGILVAKQLKDKPRLKVIIGGTAPENMTGEIKKIRPSHLLIIDSAEMGKKPGSIELIDPEQIDGYTFSTHSLPTKVMIYYLLKHFDCEVVIIGIQPKSLQFGDPFSAEVKEAAGRVAALLDNFS